MTEPVTGPYTIAHNGPFVWGIYSKKGFIAQTLPASDDGTKDAPEEVEANAHLLGASWDLLTELEAAVARIELANKEGNPIMSAWLPGARAAIAKARNQSPAA